MRGHVLKLVSGRASTGPRPHSVYLRADAYRHLAEAAELAEKSVADFVRAAIAAAVQAELERFAQPPLPLEPAEPEASSLDQVPLFPDR
jgi:hypothetical protein